MNDPTAGDVGITGAPNSSRCRRFLVTGRVQGVFYRESTRKLAEQLGLTGHARNLPDGSVEIVACGRRDSLQKLADWLGSGPPMASVQGVASTDADVEPPESFTLG